MINFSDKELDGILHIFETSDVDKFSDEEEKVYRKIKDYVSETGNWFEIDDSYTLGELRDFIENGVEIEARSIFVKSIHKIKSFGDLREYIFYNDYKLYYKKSDLLTKN